MRTIDYSKVLENEDRYIIVDVRTPSEYTHSTIPGAINIPLLTDEDHHIVGKLYKEEGRKVATKKALELFSPRLASIYDSFDSLVVRDKDIVVFCARGGMRSTTLVSFLQTLAIPVLKLNYGYKDYRKYIIDNLESIVNSKHYVTLYGNTGVGKTTLLYELEKQGYSIIDLEKYANHRGSMLGHVGLGGQTSQKMFESYVFDALRKTSNVVIVEGESKRIGKILLPDFLYDKIHSDSSIMLTTTIENRIENIKQDYIYHNNSKVELIEAVNKLRKYVSNKTVDSYIENLENEEYEDVIKDLIINYYDKKYRSGVITEFENIHFRDNNEAVESIVKYVNKLTLSLENNII